MSISNTVNSRFKKDLKLQIQLHKAFFSDDWILDSLHKSFLNQTTLDLRKEKWTFLNREFTVLISRIRTMVNGTLLNFGKRYKDDLRVIFDQWLKLHLGLDALSNQKILNGIY
jgi:hypothetical protein